MPGTEPVDDDTGVRKTDPNGLSQTLALELGTEYKNRQTGTGASDKPRGTANGSSLPIQFLLFLLFIH